MPAFGSSSTQTLTILTAASLGLSGDDFADEKPFVELGLTAPQGMPGPSFHVNGSPIGFALWNDEASGTTLLASWREDGQGGGTIRFVANPQTCGDDLVSQVLFGTDVGSVRAALSTAQWPAAPSFVFTIESGFASPSPLPGIERVVLRERLDVGFVAVAKAPVIEVPVIPGDPSSPKAPAKLSFTHYVNGQLVAVEIPVGG